MSTAAKVALAVVGVGLATTLVLPDRMTAQVTTAIFNGLSKFLGTAMGTVKA